MEQKIIYCTVRNEYILGAGTVIGAVGSHDETLLRLDFSESPAWSNLSKRCVFTDSLGRNATPILLTPDLLAEGHTDIYLCPVPYEAKTAEGEALLTIEGYQISGETEQVKIVTEETGFKVLPSRLVLPVDQDVTPDQAQQLQAAIDALKGDTTNQIGAHNTNPDAHSDIRTSVNRNHQQIALVAKAITDHTDDHDNPHGVTYQQVGADPAGAADAAQAAAISAAMGDVVVADCFDAAEPSTSAPNTWYVPKTSPRPSGKPGMTIDVRWKNGRMDGLGYDVSLIWGAPNGPDNETIVGPSSAADGLSGEYSIPAEGTVRYQLEEQNGRKHWRYVSGKLLPKQFSSATAADVADKAVPGMEIEYLPGMEAYIQLDNGNTADVMRLVPDNGPTLPAYGNGTGAKTGDIPAGYILHLVNAGDHWQIINSGSTGGSGGGVTPEQLNEPRHTTLVVHAFTHGIGYKADAKASLIKRHYDGGGIVLLNFDAPDGTGEQSYRYETYKDYRDGRGAVAVFRRPVVDVSGKVVKRIVIKIDENENVYQEEESLDVPQIDDENSGVDTTYSGKKVNQLLTKKADLVDGKVPLDQLPEGMGGVTEAQANALNDMFKVCAYIKPDVSVEYAAFRKAFGMPEVMIPAVDVVLSSKSLIFTTSATQRLTAKVEPATSTDKVVWSTTKPDVATVSDGLVSPIGNGNCTIRATAGGVYDEASVNVNIKNVIKFKVTSNLSDCSSNNSASEVIEGGDYTATITADEGYTMDKATVTVKMGGADITSSAYNANARTVSIPNVSGDLVIEASAKAIVPIIGSIVTDGLVFHLDGMNQGAESGKWEERISKKTFTLHDCVKKDHSVYFDGAKSYGDVSGNFGNPAATSTIEVVYKCETPGNHVLFSPTSTADELVTAGQYNGTMLYSTKSRKGYINEETPGANITMSVSTAGGWRNKVKAEPGIQNSWGGSTARAVIGGRYKSGAKDLFKGEIYAIRIYNRLLSESEVLQNQQFDIDNYFGGAKA